MGCCRIIRPPPLLFLGGFAAEQNEIKKKFRKKSKKRGNEKKRLRQSDQNNKNVCFFLFWTKADSVGEPPRSWGLEKKWTVIERTMTGDQQSGSTFFFYSYSHIV